MALPQAIGTNTGGISAPASQLVAITKSDSTDVTGIRGIYVGTTGDVAVMAVGDSVAQTFTAVPAGFIIPVFAKRVMSTNTSASNMLGLI